MSILMVRAARLVAVTVALLNTGAVSAAESAGYPVKPVRMIIAQTTGTSPINCTDRSNPCTPGKTE